LVSEEVGFFLPNFFNGFSIYYDYWIDSWLLGRQMTAGKTASIDSNILKRFTLGFSQFVP
jgi:hypothetical protein